MPHNTIPYYPSTGGEGCGFICAFCDNCANQNPEPEQDPQCDILTSALVYSPQDAEYPKEWVCDPNGENPRCKAFIKWDWATQGNPHDPQNTNYLQPYDPNQLTLF